MQRVWFVLVAMAFLASPAEAAKRIALVIGNANYAAVGTLANPVNDATSIAAALQKLGFEVDLATDLSGQGFRDHLKKFSSLAPEADIAVVYYAGHGVEFDGTNYLVPTDAKLDKKSDTRFEAIALDDVREAASGAQKLRLVILDACRNNPFPMLGKDGQRAATRGLIRVEPSANELVAYSARENTTAADGSGDNSPFALALLQRLGEPGREVSYMFRLVRDDVVRATGQKQEPFIYGTLGAEEIFLNPKAGGGEAVPVPALAKSAAVDWLEVKASNTPAVLQAFIADHPEDKTYRALAEERLALLSVKPAVPKTAECGALLVSVADRKDCLKPGDVFRDFDGGPEMVVVPAGKFTMGSPAGEWEHKRDESPQHDVTIRQPFAVGKFEVTFAEWDACFRDNVCSTHPSDEDGGRGKRPVFNISWNDTQEYVKWLSGKTGKTYRLLTEAEWEYAARAGTVTAYWWGNDFSADRASNNQINPVKVGSFAANAFGLYDVHGNIWEWTEDCYTDSYNSTPSDGSGKTAGDCSHRVLRGGSWGDVPANLRSAYRLRLSPDDRNYLLGFRLARTL